MNMDNLIEFAKDQCEIFPEDSYMGEYLRETLKMLQAEPCEDAVSRKELEKLKRWRLPYDTNTTIPKSDLFVKLTDIRALPPVKPTCKKGKWINKSHTSDCGIKFVASECTCCGKKTFFDCDQLVYNYCPNCGAEMESGE